MYKNKRNKICMKTKAKDKTQTYKIRESHTKQGVKVNLVNRGPGQHLQTGRTTHIENTRTFSQAQKVRLQNTTFYRCIRTLNLHCLPLFSFPFILNLWPKFVQREKLSLLFKKPSSPVARRFSIAVETQVLMDTH